MIPNRVRAAPYRSFAALLLATFVLASGAGCASCEHAGQASLSLMKGTINDPQNKSLRRGMLQFGLDKACAEMLRRSGGLREGGESAGSATNPTNGRFFARTCTQTTAANGDLLITFSGTGYTYAGGMIRKVTFDAGATVEYDQDFLLSGDVLYGYFRTRNVTKQDVHLRVIQAPLAMLGNQLTGFGDNYAKTLLSDALRDGFTVRRNADGDTDFRAGIVQLGTWPALGYATPGGNTLYNDRTEVHEQQRDFIGPIELDEGKTAVVRGRIDGAPALNVLVAGEATAKAWIEQYLSVADVTPPPSALEQQVIVQQGTEFQLTITGKGTHWLVLDNTPTIAGGMTPPGGLLDDRAAAVSYAVVLADK